MADGVTVVCLGRYAKHWSHNIVLACLNMHVCYMGKPYLKHTEAPFYADKGTAGALTLPAHVHQLLHQVASLLLEGREATSSSELHSSCATVASSLPTHTVATRQHHGCTMAAASMVCRHNCTMASAPSTHPLQQVQQCSQDQETLCQCALIAAST